MIYLIYSGSGYFVGNIMDIGVNDHIESSYHDTEYEYAIQDMRAKNKEDSEDD